MTMTPEEREQLVRFLQLMEEAQPGPKDPEAEALIAKACARQPDAAYLLVQRVLQLEMAQQASQSEISRLRQQVNDARTSGLPPSFFGANAWGRKPAETGAVASSPVASAAAPAPALPPQAPQSAWGSGLMGTLAMTAGGVVAGSLIAQGIGSLFHNREASHDSGNAATPPGGGTLVDTDYGAANQDSDGGYAAEDFDNGGDSSDVG